MNQSYQAPVPFNENTKLGDLSKSRQHRPKLGGGGGGNSAIDQLHVLGRLNGERGGGGGGGGLFTSPYSLRVQARPPRDQGLAVQSSISGRDESRVLL